MIRIVIGSFKMSDLNTSIKPLSLKHNISYAAIARFFSIVTQFGVLAIVVHLGSPEDVGALTLASAIVTPLFFLTSMGMKEVHVVDDLAKYTREDYQALRIVSGLVAVLATILIVLVFQDDETRIVQMSAITYSFVRFFGAQTNMTHGIFQRAERLDYVALSTVLRGTVGILAFGLGFWYTNSLPVAFMLETFVWFFSHFAVDRILLLRMGAEVSLAQLRKVKLRNMASLLWWVLPIGISLWMIRTSNSVPTMVLMRYADLAAVGLFGTLAYAHSAISMAMGPIGTASAPRLRRYFTEKNHKDFAGLSIKLMVSAAIFGLIAILAAWLIGDFVLKMVFGNAYRNVELLTIIITGTAFHIIGMQAMVSLTAVQAFRQRLICSGVGLATAVIASMILIPAYGIYGAGWTIVAMSVTRLAYALIVMRLILQEMRQTSNHPQRENGDIGC